MVSSLHRPAYFNPTASSWRSPETGSPHLVNDFHKKLPGYSPTKLVSLKQLAEEIGVKEVYLKDETERFGLPSFKILGASWCTFKAVALELALALDTDIDTVRAACSTCKKQLFTATDGNHGQAVARMGSILGLQVHVFVPKAIDAFSLQRVRDEGAVVTVINGSYDVAVQAAFGAAKDTEGGILIQDTAFKGYEEIPSVCIHFLSNKKAFADIYTNGSGS